MRTRARKSWSSLCRRAGAMASSDHVVDSAEGDGIVKDIAEQLVDAA